MAYKEYNLGRVVGLSAYEVWLSEGNEGSVDDYIASLKGEAFVYDDFTAEQLAALKGDKGDPFTYNDLTDDQIAELAAEVTTTTIVDINTVLDAINREEDYE